MSLLAYLSSLACTNVFVYLPDCLALLMDYARLNVSNKPSLLVFMMGITEGLWVLQCFNYPLY